MSEKVWIKCPICSSKTRIKIRQDTIFKQADKSKKARYNIYRLSAYLTVGKED